MQPETCKEALLLATQAVGMGPLTEGIGEFKPQLLWTKRDRLFNTGFVQTDTQPNWHCMATVSKTVSEHHLIAV